MTVSCLFPASKARKFGYIPGLPILSAGLIAILSGAVWGQDLPAPAPEPEPSALAPQPTLQEKTEDDVEDDEGTKSGKDEGKGKYGGKAVDPRTKAAAEKARKLRIERQATITSTLPTEGAFLSGLTLPENLVGQRGLRYGRLVILPALTLGAVYTDNANAGDEDRDEDLSANATGTIRAQSLLARHEYGFDATATTSHSFQRENDDYLDWLVGADGRLDLTRRSAVGGRVEYSRDAEDDSSVESEGDPNDVETINGTIGYEYSHNRFGYLLDLAARRQDFSGAGSADRDRTTYSVNQRFDHRTTERLTLFVTPQYAYTAFDEEVADDGSDPDVHAATGLVGFDLQLRAPVVMSASAGYTRLFFEDPDEDDADSIVANGTVAWQASPLTTFELSANHALELTTLDDADARTATSLALTGTRQIGTSLSVLGEVSGTYTDFEGLNRNDIDLRASTGLARGLTDNLFLSLGYQFQQRFSDVDGGDFYENQVFLGLSFIY